MYHFFEIQEVGLHNSFQSKPLIVVDLDGTLINGDLARLTYLNLRFLGKLKGFYLRFIRVNKTAFSLFLVKEFDNLWLSSLNFRMKSQRYVIKNLNTDLIAALKIQQTNHDIYIASASSQELLDWIAQTLLFSKGFGSTSKYYNRGDDKWTLIENETRNLSEIPLCIAISDNSDDQGWGAKFSSTMYFSRGNTNNSIDSIKRHSCMHG
jgi:hypothetical protein